MDEEDEIEEMVVEAIIQLSNLLLCGNDSDDEEFRLMRERGRWVTVDVDVDAFRRLPDLTFKMHFRMSTRVFELLVESVGNHLHQKGRIKRLRTPLDLALLMGLWVLGNPDSFRSIALHFKTSPGVVHFHYLCIIEALTELSEVYITWPSVQERDTIKDNFERISGFPGVVGCIDTTHLYLTAPYEDPEGYVNRHHSHSILAQVVCDDRLLVRDLHAGEPGSMHDSRVFRRSPLCENLLTKPNMMTDDEHLLGDGAYINTNKLLIPFKNNGNLTGAQKYFNRTLSSIRSCVERLFRLAKGKWRRMKNFESHCIQYAVQTVVSSFVLHNFLILNGEVAPQVRTDHVPDEDWRREEDEVDPEWDYPDVEEEPDHPHLAAARAAGAIKRRNLTVYFQTGEVPH